MMEAYDINGWSAEAQRVTEDEWRMRRRTRRLAEREVLWWFVVFLCVFGSMVGLAAWEMRRMTP